MSSPTPAQIQAVIDSATIALLLSTVSVPAGMSPRMLSQIRQSAVTLFAGFAPRDAVEAAMAVRVVALHHVIVDSVARSMQADMPAALVLRHRGRAGGPVPEVAPAAEVVLPATVDHGRDMEGHKGRRDREGGGDAVVGEGENTPRNVSRRRHVAAAMGCRAQRGDARDRTGGGRGTRSGRWKD